MIPDHLKKQPTQMKPHRVSTRFTTDEWKILLAAYERRTNPEVYRSMSEYLRRLIVIALHNVKL